MLIISCHWLEEKGFEAAGAFGMKPLPARAGHGGAAGAPRGHGRAAAAATAGRAVLCCVTLREGE